MRFDNFEHYCSELGVNGIKARNQFNMFCESERCNNTQSYDEQYKEAIEFNTELDKTDLIVDVGNIVV